MENYPTHQTSNDEEIDFSRILFLFIGKWYWFVIGIVLALAAAFFFNHYYKQQAYTIDTSILITDDDKDFNRTNMFGKSMMIPGRCSVTIENETEHIKSRA
jgi:uncharacterized protein involved in exopolysaccharide biosynthesis